MNFVDSYNSVADSTNQTDLENPYKCVSGNLIIILSDHLFQSVIFENFFKATPISESNWYERNFKKK